MKLREALEHSRIFECKGSRYFAFIFPRKHLWPADSRKKFTVVCNDHPMPNKTYDFSSNIEVKPVIRVEQSTGFNKSC